ncbi:hypothetical protein ACYCO6_25255 [Methylobacterium sp. CM6257]
MSGGQHVEVYGNLNVNISTSSRTSANARIITSRVPIHCPPKFNVDLCVRSLAEMIQQRFDDGWSVHLVTIKPSRISQDRRSIATLIHDPAKAVYTRLITRTVRRLSTGTEVSAIMGIENSLIGGFGGRR